MSQSLPAPWFGVTSYVLELVAPAQVARVDALSYMAVTPEPLGGFSAICPKSWRMRARAFVTTLEHASLAWKRSGVQVPSDPSDGQFEGILGYVPIGRAHEESP
jgi:hypothetical protein